MGKWQTHSKTSQINIGPEKGFFVRKNVFSCLRFYVPFNSYGQVKSSKLFNQLTKQKEENDSRINFMINLHESMTEPGSNSRSLDLQLN